MVGLWLVERFRAEMTQNPLRHDLLLGVGARVVLPQGFVRGQVGVAGDAREPLLIYIKQMYMSYYNTTKYKLIKRPKIQIIKGTASL